MTINDRTKALRKTLGLTQEEFASRLGISYAAISMTERGKNGVSAQNIRSMVREFGVREDWLRTGEGEMFTSTVQQEQIAAFIAGILDDDQSFKLRLISTLSRMTEDEWGILEAKMQEITKNAASE